MNCVCGANGRAVVAVSSFVFQHFPMEQANSPGRLARERDLFLEGLLEHCSIVLLRYSALAWKAQ